MPEEGKDAHMLKVVVTSKAIQSVWLILEDYNQKMFSLFFLHIFHGYQEIIIFIYNHFY